MQLLGRGKQELYLLKCSGSSDAEEQPIFLYSFPSTLVDVAVILSPSLYQRIKQKLSVKLAKAHLIVMLHLLSKCLPFLALVPSVASQTLGSFQDVLGGNENLTSFASFLQNYTDVYGALSWSRDFTLLVPSNDAMDRIPYTSLNTVFDSADRDAIGAVLQYHVLSGIRRTEEVSSSLQFFPTWLTNATYANVTNGQRIGLVQQAGDVLIAVSGGGARSTVTSRVSKNSCQAALRPTSARHRGIHAQSPKVSRARGGGLLLRLRCKGRYIAFCRPCLSAGTYTAALL